jgi:hypothetical protein
MNTHWLNVIGLLLDITGAIFLSYGLIITKKDAIDLGVSRICGDSDEDNLKLPAVQDRVKQSRNAKIGVIFLVTGFLFQLCGSWPN